jgi:hypothetical protein
MKNFGSNVNVHINNFNSYFNVVNDQTKQKVNYLNKKRKNNENMQTSKITDQKVIDVITLESEEDDISDSEISGDDKQLSFNLGNLIKVPNPYKTDKEIEFIDLSSENPFYARKSSTMKNSHIYTRTLSPPRMTSSEYLPSYIDLTEEKT